MLSEEELEADLRCQGAREGRERGQRSRAGQDERTRQTSWAGLGDLLGDLLRGLLVGNSHCWWRAQMQLLLLHQMVPRAPITVHWFHWDRIIIRNRPGWVGVRVRTTTQLVSGEERSS